MRVILLSGGLDSAWCLHCHGADLAVGFDYGQEHLIELDYAVAIAAKYGVPFERHQIMPMPLVDDVVFAGRNAVMLVTAAAIAQARGITEVMIGCNKSDAARFPDCRPEFISAMDDALNLAYGLRVSAPLLGSSKAEIVKGAREAGLMPTWTCYHPKDRQPCGECYACRSMRVAGKP